MVVPAIALVGVLGDWLTPPSDWSGIMVLGCAVLLAVHHHSRRLALLVVAASSWIVIPATSGAVFVRDLMRGQQRVYGVHQGLRTSIPGTHLLDYDRCYAERVGF